MSYKSIVYRVLIASPSDVYEEREITTRIIQNWNDVNSFSKKIVLLPVKWETHSTPSYDVRPQEAINKQVVDSADLVVGLFWAKIGSETGKEISGTIEEIKRAAKNGKDVMIYFSKRGIDPSQIDIEQLQALNKFKEEVYKNALVENFVSIADFRDKFFRQLEFKIKELQKGNADAKTNVKVSFIDIETGELDGNTKKVEAEMITLNNSKINQIVKRESSRIENRRSDFIRELKKYVNKVNCVPIILGVKNKDSVMYNNLSIDLEAKVSVSDALSFLLIGSPEIKGISDQLENGILMSEDEEKISSLFTETFERTAPKTISIYTEQVTVFPNKTKSIKPLILFYPSKNVEITFATKILSNSLLIPIENKFNLMISVKQRDIKHEEISEIIKDLPEYDDLPF